MHTNVSQNASQPGENEPSTGLTAKMADSRAPSPQNGRTSPASDDPRSFANVTAGRPATPPAPASDGMPRTPRLRPTFVLGEIPYLSLAAPTSNSEQTQALSIPEALPDETSFPPLDIAPPTQAPTTETAKSKKAARKQAAKLKKTTNRDKGTPPPSTPPPTASQQPPAAAAQQPPLTPQPPLTDETPGQDGRKRRRVSRERVEDGGESSQLQPVVRLQQSPGPLLVQTSAAKPTPTTTSAVIMNHGPAANSTMINNERGEFSQLQARSTIDLAFPPPPVAHPFAEWDPVNGGYIWNHPPMAADPHWRPNASPRRTGGPPSDAAHSDDNSLYAASFDDVIRSYRSPPPGLSEVSPVHRTTTNAPPRAPTQPLPPSAPGGIMNQTQGTQPGLSTRTQDFLAMNIDLSSDPNGSILAPPWHKEPGRPRRVFTENASLRYKPYPGSSGRQMPIAAPPRPP
ncbi:hypothetical protein EVJ58_g9727 [Rhodofomes roseus]|uniref:Uncharacterized protein n=1 Tax=Rhodofomes roseus TaxID=34475 RepID=A0A4Y9XSC4_9APHY|nr:hypothetical protein EVJ58_g9727 [Rhodofomes roseus]